jgi:hypothetical protein
VFHGGLNFAVTLFVGIFCRWSCIYFFAIQVVLSIMVGLWCFYFVGEKIL